MEHYLKLRDNQFINQSMTHYGVLLQNNEFNTVKSDRYKQSPYTVIDEGILFHPSLCDKIRALDNVKVYKNSKLVFEKNTNNDGIHCFNDENVFDLYDNTEYDIVNQILNSYESDRKIYIVNTENVELNSDIKCLAGLASGQILAELAYKLNLEKVIYYDFSQDSIEFQKALLQSDDRKQLYIDNLSRLTTGYMDASINDIDNLDIVDINKYYDYLKTIDVEYMVVDIRNDLDVRRLFDVLPANSTLWLSNVLHYITMINQYSTDRYQLIDSLAKDKNITILPHTRIYYES